MEFKHPIGSAIDEHEAAPSKPKGLLPSITIAKPSEASPLKDRALQIFWLIRDMLRAITK